MRGKRIAHSDVVSAIDLTFSLPEGENLYGLSGGVADVSVLCVPERTDSYADDCRICYARGWSSACDVFTRACGVQTDRSPDGYAGLFRYVCLDDGNLWFQRANGVSG